MTEPESSALGRRVREARLRKGLTQQELAEDIHLERTVVNKIESGTRKVTALELADIALALDTRMSSFFRDPVQAVVSHRSSHGLDTADSQIDQLLQSLADDVQLIDGLGDLSAPLPQDPWEVPRTGEDAEEMAQKVRDLLSIDPSTPFTGISRRAEELGFLIFSQDLGIDTADGGTLLLPRGGISLINSANKVGRRRLAAVHELAHFLTADDYTIDWRVDSDALDRERQFDRFARALLLPDAGIRPLWSRLRSQSDVRTAAVIVGGRYYVDMSTLARRLTDLQIEDGVPAAEVRTVRTTRSDIIEHDLHPSDEFSGTTQPRAYQMAVIELVRHERISRERALDLLWDTLSDEDLPRPRTRGESEIWQYVS